MTVALKRSAGPTTEGTLAMAALLSFGVVGWEQLLHTGPGGPPLYQALHWVSDSLLALPLALAAIWVGSRLAGRRRTARPRRADALARACLIAIVFAVLLIPGGIAHEWIDTLTKSHAAISVHTHGGIVATRDPREPAVLAAYLLHAFSDGLIGQLVGLPLLLVAFAWMARRRTVRVTTTTRLSTTTTTNASGAFHPEGMTFAS
jgi:hypothetical protein